MAKDLSDRILLTLIRFFSFVELISKQNRKTFFFDSGAEYFLFEVSYS
jgi:hypothetical protein